MIRRSLLIVSVGLLTACGGGLPDPQEAPASLAAAAPPTRSADSRLPSAAMLGERRHRLAAASAITPSQLMDWAEGVYPGLFPKGPTDQTLATPGMTYTLRYYAASDNYLGVGADGVVYGLGEFSGRVIQQYGRMTDYTCQVAPDQCKATKTGVFHDALVQGIDYYIEGLKAGTTDAAGHFDYVPGKPVTFMIGRVTLGTASGDLSVVTPASLTSEGAQVTSILVLLQSLDADKNPANGISISSALAARLVTAVDLSQPGATLASLRADLPGVAWVSPSDALTHFASAAAQAAPTSAVNALVDAMVGYWLVPCDGQGSAQVLGVVKVADNMIQFADSLTREYRNKDCTGPFVESLDHHASPSDYSTVLGGRVNADGSLWGYSSSPVEGSAGQVPAWGTISADRQLWQAEVSGPSGMLPITFRRLASLAFPA